MQKATFVLEALLLVELKISISHSLVVEPWLLNYLPGALVARSRLILRPGMTDFQAQEQTKAIRNLFLILTQLDQVFK